MKEIKDKIKPKEIMIFSTDKSGRFSVDSPKNYEEAVKLHITNDVEINMDSVKKIENKINQHMRQFNKMFKVGSTHQHEENVTAATISITIPKFTLIRTRL